MGRKILGRAHQNGPGRRVWIFKIDQKLNSLTSFSDLEKMGRFILMDLGPFWINLFGYGRSIHFGIFEPFWAKMRVYGEIRVLLVHFWILRAISKEKILNQGLKNKWRWLGGFVVQILKYFHEVIEKKYEKYIKNEIAPSMISKFIWISYFLEPSEFVHCWSIYLGIVAPSNWLIMANIWQLWREMRRFGYGCSIWSNLMELFDMSPFFFW